MHTKTWLASLVGLVISGAVWANPLQVQDLLAEAPYFNKTDNGYDLQFSPKTYRTLEAKVNGETVRFRAFEKIVYVQQPLEPDYQTLNIYVPEAYFNEGNINGFTAKTAPIFLPNAVGGYMPAKAATYDAKGFGNNDKPNAILTALSKGYVVASVGARGRTLEKDGKYTGKAPAAIIDLKSAVRYLHFNDEVMPGDANKIISNGTSAGGALSALLGASGDNPDYAYYLKHAGAAEASDAIFAVSAYCPITNLEHADSAYEWEFNGLNEYRRMDMSRLNADSYNDRSQAAAKATIDGTLTAEEITLSDQLKAEFPAYLNSLKLKDEKGNTLTLDAQGNGSFKDYVKSVIIRAADKAHKNGTSFADQPWVNVSKEGVTDIDWDGYIHSEKRMKSPPAFDALNLSSGENNLFGTETVNNQHFTVFSWQHSTEKGKMADKNVVRLMNAMNYVDQSKTQHWRIRVGTSDRDTSHAIGAMLAIKLRMADKQVDYETPWGVPHAGDYDLDELFQWVDSISK
ncbi:alpha/beta hydrolase [Aggregatibacter actinomycetemcomitans]|uniref:subtype B tannase n=1 Tax=Aggregatibacter actinomycetemcomitans TaxID=714 RepID=UPI00022ADABF|nr:subtype B tannase [Aggregatibacter actinomycetemcomitans]KOE69697.1 alpha/beta hydrolase [Aggregatibacter actinomycetemcomitans serotype f str. D18P1]OZV18461.1 alpha/beta hydrolase [Aggregatibacter actinomycetemcomitans]